MRAERVGNFVGGCIIAAALVIIAVGVVENRRIASQGKRLDRIERPTKRELQRKVEKAIRALGPKQTRELQRRLAAHSRQRRRGAAQHARQREARNRPLSARPAHTPRTKGQRRSAPQAPQRRPQAPKTPSRTPSAPGSAPAGGSGAASPRPPRRRPIEVTAPAPTITVCTPLLGVNCDR